jgi:hypothetical protein
MKKPNAMYTPPQHTGTGLNVTLVLLLIGAVLFLSVNFISFLFLKEGESYKDIRLVPQLVEHKVRLIRPDGSIEKELTVKNYDNSVKITTDNGNLCVADFSRNSYMFFAPTGWYLEPVDSKEE